MRVDHAKQLTNYFSPRIFLPSRYDIFIVFLNERIFPPPLPLISYFPSVENYGRKFRRKKRKKKERKIFGKKKEKEKDERIYSLDRSVILNHPVHFIAKRVETTLEESVAQMSLKYGKDYAFPRKALFTTTGLCHGYPIKIAAD